MTSYADRAKAHLGRYRRTRLGVAECGSPKGKTKEYSHILPERLRFLNILEGYRAELTDWLSNSGSAVPLHQGFHHLNSSQAACLNLFWPLLASAPPSLVPRLLEIGSDNITSWTFEKIVDLKEFTNFDLYLELKSGARVYIEFKYAETEFASAKPNKERQKKLRGIYVPALKEKVGHEYLLEEKFFRNYQIFRNLVYFQPENGDQVIFIYPKGNRTLDTLPLILDDAILDKKVRANIKILYLEDLISNASAVLPSNEHQLHAHLNSYFEKYLDLFEK